MGTQFTKPNFSPIMGVITTMMTDKEMIAKYPLSENAQKILESKEILSMLMNPENDFTGMLAGMCKDNYKLSKKMAKVHIKNINKQNQDVLENSLKSLKSFMLIKDSLQETRLNWVFGIPLITNVKFQYEDTTQYGIQRVNQINDCAYDYKSHVIPENTTDYPLCGQLLF